MVEEMRKMRKEEEEQRKQKEEEKREVSTLSSTKVLSCMVNVYGCIVFFLFNLRLSAGQLFVIICSGAIRR